MLHWNQGLRGLGVKVLSAFFKRLKGGFGFGVLPSWRLGVGLGFQGLGFQDLGLRV